MPVYICGLSTSVTQKLCMYLDEFWFVNFGHDLDLYSLCILLSFIYSQRKLKGEWLNPDNCVEKEAT